MRLLSPSSTEISGQRVLVRCNFDVPLENGQVEDSTRIEAAIPTLKLLLDLHASLLILAHAGRPDGKYDQAASLQPIIPVLGSLLHQPVTLVPYAADYSRILLPDEPLVLLENLRFWPQEEAADGDFARFLASLGSVYINDAFANCHRAHTSMVTLASLLQPRTYAGLSLAREIAILEQVTTRPKRPFVVVIGGAKVETKEPLVTALAPRADTLLVGGKIAADLKTSTSLPQNVELAELIPDGKDITLASAKRFAQVILNAGTVIWNGTMGMFEADNYQQGTTIVAQAMDQTQAYTLIGGGDTEAALTQLNLEKGIDHISTGGGAMLTYLSEGHLVAIDTLS